MQGDQFVRALNSICCFSVVIDGFFDIPCPIFLSVEKKNAPGGTAMSSVLAQIHELRSFSSSL